jgi:hypothetical protein
LNKLPNHQIQHLKFIRIPKTKEEMDKINIELANKIEVEEKLASLRSEITQAKERVNTFRNTTGCNSNEEAKYYLNECDNDIEAAIKLWKEDTEWEKNHPLENSSSSSPSLLIHENDEIIRARRKRRTDCLCFAFAVDDL